jgi:hypothetical protein
VQSDHIDNNLALLANNDLIKKSKYCWQYGFWFDAHYQWLTLPWTNLGLLSTVRELIDCQLCCASTYTSSLIIPLTDTSPIALDIFDSAASSKA